MSNLNKIRERMANAYNMPWMMVRVFGMYEPVLSDEQQYFIKVSHAFAKYLFESESIPPGVCTFILDELFNPLEKPRQSPLFTFKNSRFFRGFLSKHFSIGIIDEPESKTAEAVMTFGLLRLLELVHNDSLTGLDDQILYSELYAWLKTKGLVEL